jgi:dihydrofolate reductase
VIEADGRPIALVTAIAANGVLGHKNAVPWRLATDLKRFRRLTLGKPILMGRKTYESIGQPLPERISIVVSRDVNFRPPAGVHVARDLAAGLRDAERAAQALQAEMIALIGGADLFAALIDRVTRLHLTFVELTPQGDSFFPVIDWSLWREVWREKHLPQMGDDAAFTFVDFVRRTPGK